MAGRQHHICGQHKPSQGYEDSQLLDGGKNVFIPSDVIDLIQLFDDKKLVKNGGMSTRDVGSVGAYLVFGGVVNVNNGGCAQHTGNCGMEMLF